MALLTENDQLPPRFELEWEIKILALGFHPLSDDCNQDFYQKLHRLLQQTPEDLPSTKPTPNNLTLTQNRTCPDILTRGTHSGQICGKKVSGTSVKCSTHERLQDKSHHPDYVQVQDLVSKISWFGMTLDRPEYLNQYLDHWLKKWDLTEKFLESLELFLMEETQDLKKYSGQDKLFSRLRWIQKACHWKFILQNGEAPSFIQNKQLRLQQSRLTHSWDQYILEDIKPEDRKKIADEKLESLELDLNTL